MEILAVSKATCPNLWRRRAVERTEVSSVWVGSPVLVLRIGRHGELVL